MSMTTRRRLSGITATTAVAMIATVFAGPPSVAESDAATAVPRTTVFTRGDGGYHTFRIPALVSAPDGTLLAFAEGRVNSPSDDGDIDLVLRRSTDGGATWGPVQVLADDGPNKWGNPVPIVDETTGRIVVNTTRTGGSVTASDIACGRATPEETRRAFVLHSDDNGATWSDPVDISPQVRPDDWRHFVGGPGHGVQITQGVHAGRLVIPGVHSAAPPPDSGRECAGALDSGDHALYSDDGGETWHLGANDEPGDGILVPNENAVVELADGRLYFSTRDQGSATRSQRLDTTSSDGGETFDAPYDEVDGVITTQIQGSLVRLPATASARDRVVLSVPGHPTARENLTLWSSFDSGETWRRSYRVYDGPSGYSDVTLLGERDGNRDIGVLFESGDRLYEEETTLSYSHDVAFVRVPERLLDRPVPPARVTPDTTGAHDGLVSGSPAVVTGRFGRGLRLAGDYVELALTDALAFDDEPFTAATWFRTGRTINNTALFYAYTQAGAEPKWWVRLEPGSSRIRAQFETDTETVAVDAAGSFADDQWHHVAITRDGTGITLYVDGVVAADAPVTGSVSVGARTGIRIGARTDGVNYPMVGVVDEAWLFDTALTADQVADLAQRNAVEGARPMAHLPMERVTR